MKTISDQDGHRIIRELKHGRCILVIGPDVAINPDTQVPLIKELAHQLAREVDQNNFKVQDPDDLQHVSGLLVSQSNKDRYDLEMMVEGFYKKYTDSTGFVHQQLAKLPFQWIITTSPDEFMSNALKQANKNPNKYFYNFRSANLPEIKEPTVNSPIVFSLYGAIKHEEKNVSESLVLTENDLLEYLVKIIKGEPRLPSLLASRLYMPNMSFLFVGFGFDHWYLRLLLHVFRAQGSTTRSFALEESDFNNAGDYRAKTALFYNQTLSIEFCQLPYQKFAQKLANWYETESPVETPKESEDMPESTNAPRAFLCYNSEDKVIVEDLQIRLNKNGINTWRDRDNLRGGDDWNRRIEHVIKHSTDTESENIDYFLVLISKHFPKPGQRSYINKEVMLALEEAAYYHPGKFVIPVFIDESINQPDSPLQLRSDLREKLYEDINTTKGFEKLVNNILSDWRERLPASVN